jgi:ABC-type branched-subunit amino acid transport system substrate-binding protein
MADVSGPIPGVFAGAQRGLTAWAAYVNSTGGIDGRRVVIKFKDTALSCDSTRSAAQSLTTSAFALIGVASALDSCAEPALKASPSMLYIPAFTINFPELSLPNVVQSPPQPPGASTLVYKYVRQKYGAAAVAKTAALYSSETTANFQYNKAAAETVGFKYLYERAFGLTETNFTSDVLRMKSEGVQVVDIQDAGASIIADFVNSASQQGYHPVIIGGSAYDVSFFNQVTTPAAANKIIMSVFSQPYIGVVPSSGAQVQALKKWAQKTNPGAPLDLYTVLAWIDGVFFQDAMSNVQGTPTQAKLVAAAKSVTSFNANGLIANSNPGQGVPYSCGVIMGASNGRFVRLSPTSSGFNCDAKWVAPSKTH